MTYRKYKTYKDSNIDEFGEIPYHWDISKVKYELKNLDSMRIPLSSEVRGNIEKIYDYYGASGVIDKVDNYIFDEELILIGEDGANLLTRSTPLAFIAKGKFWVNNHAHILKPINNNIIYLANQLELRDYTTLVTGSAQPKLTQENLGDLTLIKPPIEEQEIIARFLSKKTLEIDALIEEKRKLIELLKEKREAIITEAVTKGVDKNVKMKESGVEWIGEIPSHWKKFRFKNICNINPNKSELTIDNERLVSFVPMENIKNGKIDLSIVKKLGEVYSGYSYFGDGDIIMAKVTPCFENGNIAIVEKMKNKVGFGTTELHVLRVNEKVNNKYLYYLLQENGFKSKAISSMYGVGGLKRIPTEFIANFEIYIPDVKEQIEIIKYIEGKLNNIDIILKETNKSIEKIKEYKKSLISEVITGKIDLRGCKG